MSTTASRPRWGTFSVVAHRDVDLTAVDILLYDRLVFPAPVSSICEQDWGDEDRARLNTWRRRDREEHSEEMRRDPDLLLRLAARANGLIHLVTWAGKIRDEWQELLDLAKQIVGEIDGFAIGLTPLALSLRAYTDARSDPLSPPLPIAAYRSKERAVADLDLRKGATAGSLTERRSELHRKVGVLFHRMLEMPVRGNPEYAFERAVELSSDAEYGAARRALFEWEDARTREEWPTRAAIKELQELVITHDILVQKAFKKTQKRAFYRIARLLFSGAAELVGHVYNVPGTGAGSDAIVEIIEAKFAALDERGADPKTNPGAALSSAISALTHP